MEISKRDYFAAQALTGLLARAPRNDLDASPDGLAAQAFEHADAMLKLSKTLMAPVEIDPDQLPKEVHLHLAGGDSLAM